MAKDYKQLKQEHVSGHTGSSLFDINSVSLALPLSILLWSVLQSRMHLFTPQTLAACFVDVLLHCCVPLLATTVYSSSPWLLNLLLLLPAALLYLSSEPAHAKATPQKPPKKVGQDQELDPLPVKPFITHYRGAMMVITCVAILAVDFRVFPRRFAKAENWGTSLMDMGVGSFVFTNGIVSVRSSLKTGTANLPPLSKRFLTSLRHSLPLLVLGVIRLISVKGLDYAEHVTEYGVHWNFFFTLGLLPPFVALFESALSLVPSYALLAFFLASSYEIVLDKTRLSAYILTAKRTDLISQNREGIFSFFGYLAIFLAGQALGALALPRSQPTTKNDTLLLRFRQSILGKLCLTALMWTALFHISISYYGLGLGVSRRLANLPYFLWVCSYNSYQVAICCAIETVLFPGLHKARSSQEEKQKAQDATSTVLRALNRNGLAVFLLANLMTGLVNMIVPTLDMGPVESMGILVTYIVVIAGVAMGLDRWNISIKL
ncbi:unnamed protein product [Periconia digitata]|uniref:GPI-anchored wall transfer protein n=1 Tax=Periconia digitata TaxID=1303443 RepID=A0A9W4U496_9PLEO|nr:unnamed protein product [Periconia digitata]